MKSARSIWRRSRLRFRRSSRREETADNSQQVAEENKQENPETSTANVDDALPEVSVCEMVAAAGKPSDLDNSSDDSQHHSGLKTPRNYIDQLLRKQRSELMYELHTIQNSQRPVSKGNQRQHLERFFRRRLHGDVSDNTSEGDRESYQCRNGVVCLEVEGLSRQRPVTQRLQSDTFRHALENIIRGTLIRQEREVEAALRLRTAGLPGNGHLPLAAEAGAISHTLSETASLISGVSSLSEAHFPPPPPAHYSGIPLPPPPPPAPGEFRAPPLPRPPPHLQQHHGPQPAASHGPRWQQQQQRAQQQAQQQAQQHLDNRMPLTPPWLLQNRASANQTVQDRLFNIPAPANSDGVQQAQRETTVMEISDLVHRQLVQETLESDFRGRLEFLMTEHIQSSGSDGVQVMNFVRSIPQSQQHRRNDFSHLGIHVRAAGGAASNGEGAVGGAAVSVAFVQEMESLRSRMDELHNMVRISMEMQLDLQRAIRQEVAAALHQQNGTTPSTASPVSQPAQEGNCIICLDKEVDAVLYQCGHMCVCLTCGMRLSTMGSHCPMCRAPIRDVIRAYRCQRN